MSKKGIVIAAISIFTIIVIIFVGIFLVQNQTTHQPTSGIPYGSPSPQPSSTVASDSGFKGIYQFAGHNSSTNVDKLYLQGTFLGYYWSQLEPQKGRYNWTIIDRDMKPWVDSGKKIILRVSTAGWTRWEPYAGHGTPQWVYDSGVSSVTETDNSVLPQYWNPKFLENLQDFIHALGLRYDGNPNITCIEMGIGVGGETKVDTHNENPQRLQLWQNIGYSDSMWWNTIQRIISIYTSSFHKTPLAILPDATFIGNTSGYHENMVVDYAVKRGLWLQDDSLSATRTLPSTWMTVPHIEEQFVATKGSGDSLLDDLQTALRLKASYLLVFSSDISNPDNQSALQQVATQAR